MIYKMATSGASHAQFKPCTKLAYALDGSSDNDDNYDSEYSQSSDE